MTDNMIHEPCHWCNFCLVLSRLVLPSKLNIEMYCSWFTQEVFPQLNIIVELEAISK